MDGFIEFAVHKHGKSIADASTLLNMFTPDRVPVISTLAQEFAVMDRFFCSHPGPTWPNRLFQLMGTSKGCTETSKWDPKTLLYTGKTIFDSVEEAGLDWRFYYADAPLEVSMIEKLTLSPEKVKGWRAFKRDIADGNLPAFSWVNPRWFVNETTGEGANDQVS
jgi:phospholipase C